MKKRLFLLSCMILVMLGLCSCDIKNIVSAPEPTPIPDIDPVSILSPDEVYEALDYVYVPMIEGGVVYHEDGYKHTITYVSDPLGQGDPVELTVSQRTDSVPAETIWYTFDNNRQMRSDAVSVDGLGEAAYIAFPWIHVYDRGCSIDIAAGSGDTQEQQELLIKLAQTAVTNLEAQVSPLEEDQE